MSNEIVVGLDDTPSSKLAIEWAAQQAKSTDAVLRAVHVSSSELEDTYRQVLTAMFEGVSPRPNWALEFLSGYAGEALVRQSKDAHLLVVGTREHGHRLVGSVCHYCISHAACPVVAVPSPARDHRVGSPREEEADQAAGAVGPETESAARKSSGVGSLRRALVVAGVDGSAESLAAARYAEAAAEMRGCDVALVHAFPPPPPSTARETVAAMSSSRTAAEKLLATVAGQLAVSSRVHVRTLVEPGDATAVLENAARRSEMLVLGRDDVSWGERVLRGAVTSQVAQRVACPLVVVPRGWHTGHVGKPQPVVVAMDVETSAESALSVAYREAQLRQNRLVVLHAEPIGTSARDVAAAGVDLAVLVANWKQDHPEVTVSTTLVTGDPDAELVRWSRSAAVLVVGRPHESGWGSWMRWVARDVMRQTHCPLIIAPSIPVPAKGRPASAAVAQT
ncbi:MAG TPA: universal stress protein [Propionibacteriaceae bacterium]|nr:universal stress protein [Propionibacteriaceae bacterium]